MLQIVFQGHTVTKPYTGRNNALCGPPSWQPPNYDIIITWHFRDDLRRLPLELQ